MLIRGVHCWQQTRWPGRSGRMHYAHTLFNLYVIRCLQFLSMRVFEENPSSAGGRPAKIQGVLDELWRSSPADQPVIVRDARWLIPLAQSLITDELAPYFEVAQQVTETLQEADVLEIQKAHVRMLGGHLTSQIRYYCTKDGVSVNIASFFARAPPMRSILHCWLKVSWRCSRPVTAHYRAAMSECGSTWQEPSVRA